MSAIKESLEANKKEILENLPAEFHGEFEKEVEAAGGAAEASDELEAIKAEIKAHPDCDDALIAEVEANPTAHRADAPPSAEEQEAAKQEALAKVAELKAPEEEE